ncbi:MAG: hypothetical protein NTX86_05905 [Candidatus Dependentiae bacterium]|nr:hypothetical protein [Candidatus Dependentiae bacterium]
MTQSSHIIQALLLSLLAPVYGHAMEKKPISTGLGATSIGAIAGAIGAGAGLLLARLSMRSKNIPSTTNNSEHVVALHEEKKTLLHHIEELEGEKNQLLVDRAARQSQLDNATVTIADQTTRYIELKTEQAQLQSLLRNRSGALQQRDDQAVENAAKHRRALQDQMRAYDEALENTKRSVANRFRETIKRDATENLAEHAMLLKKPTFIAKLIEQQADIHAKNSSGKTALEQAMELAQANDLGCLKAIFEKSKNSISEPELSQVLTLLGNTQNKATQYKDLTVNTQTSAGHKKDNDDDEDSDGAKL